MLKLMVIAAIVVAVLVAAVLAYAATRPDSFQLARSISIKAPPEIIFPLINDLRSFNRWNPFLKSDPATKLVYSGPDSGKGAAHEWDGNSRVGKGRVEITDSVPLSKIVIKLDMIKPIEGHNRVEFTLQPDGDATTVTWAMSGQSAYIAKVMSVVVSMDKMVGGEFEKGLADLKTLAER
jgi:carbon monoxide dehydrogenase subunit G